MFVSDISQIVYNLAKNAISDEAVIELKMTECKIIQRHSAGQLQMLYVLFQHSGASNYSKILLRKIFVYSRESECFIQL